MSAAHVTYFASGSNHPGEILGLADCGQDIGVAVHELTTDKLGRSAVDTLLSLAGSGRLIFVDSGAFSEVCFHNGRAECNCADTSRPQIVEPITDTEWRRRLAIYQRLADALGPQLFPVAPDCVGFQGPTLRRLRRYAEQCRNLIGAGAQLVVPLQRGRLSITAMYDRCAAILGTHNFVVGIPSMKGAVPTEQVAELLTSRPQITRVHLLGLGPKNDRYPELTQAVHELRPDVALSCDSALLVSLVGKSNGPGGGPRAYTAASDLAREMAEQCIYTTLDGVEHASWIGQPSRWLHKTGLQRAAKAAFPERAERRAFLADPDGWLAAYTSWTSHEIGRALDAEWRTWFMKSASVTWRKRTSFHHLFRTAA